MGIKGAILGDIVGSRFEHYPAFRYQYNYSYGNNTLNGMSEYDMFTDTCKFTDDTVMSIATAIAYNTNKNYALAYRQMYERYPNSGYGKAFNKWAQDTEAKAYNSFGNGSAMRVSFIGEVMKKNPFRFMVEMEAAKTAKVTHNHPEGIKGAKVTAVCVWMAERGKMKEDILEYLMKKYPEAKNYNNLKNSKEKRDNIKFSSKCQDTVPLAISCFLQTENFFDCMELINSMECDTDTIGAIAGAICESFYGTCTELDNKILRAYLPRDLINDLQKCGIDVYDRKTDREWSKFHDIIEETAIKEKDEKFRQLEGLTEQEVNMSKEFDFERIYKRLENYQCENQMTIDEFLETPPEPHETNEDIGLPYNIPFAEEIEEDNGVQMSFFDIYEEDSSDSFENK